jgi:hypothetical protein
MISETKLLTLPANFLSLLRFAFIHHTANRLEKGFAVLRLLEDGFALSSPIEDMIPIN